MHFLITGGAGFIGSHVVDLLLHEGNEVTILDDFNDFYDPSVKRANIASHRKDPHFRLICEDIRNFEGLRHACVGTIDTIIHLAARAGVRPSINDPLLYQDVNVRGTQNLLELARERGVKQFVFASSSSVYGVDPNVPWRETESGLRPISPYASTKVSGELLGHVYSHLYGIQFIALRFFTVYGPRQRPDLAIHKFARLIMQGRSVSLFGDGTNGRDYTYIADIVQGLRSAINYRGAAFEIFNLGSCRPVSLTELISLLERAIGKTAIIHRLPNQPGDVPQTWADISKASRLLGYRPSTPLSDGIREFVQWLEHQSTGSLPLEGPANDPAGSAEMGRSGA